MDIVNMCAYDSAKTPTQMDMGGWATTTGLAAIRDQPVDQLVKDLLTIRRRHFELTAFYDRDGEEGARGPPLRYSLRRVSPRKRPRRELLTSRRGLWEFRVSTGRGKRRKPGHRTCRWTAQASCETRLGPNIARIDGVVPALSDFDQHRPGFDPELGQIWANGGGGTIGGPGSESFFMEFPSREVVYIVRVLLEVCAKLRASSGGGGSCAGRMPSSFGIVLCCPDGVRAGVLA